MSIKQIALSISKLEKTVAALPVSSLQQQLHSHIQAMLNLLLKERIQENASKNFTLKPLAADSLKKPSAHKKKGIKSPSSDSSNTSDPS